MADAKQKLQIELIIKNEKALGNLNSKIKQTAKSSFSLGTAFKFAMGALATVGIGKMIKGFVAVGKEVESLNLRFKYLFGSAQEGALAFAELNKFAATVPFSLGEIAAGSGNLATVAGDAKGLAEIMKITGNVAAVAGMDFKTTAEQIQRSFSAGISAADLFRDKGIKAMLGFKDGVKYTVEETQEVFKEAFGPGGIYSTAADDFAKTFAGTLSMIGDTYRKFQETVSGAFFDELKNQFGDLDTFLKDNMDTITQLGEQLGAGFVKALKIAGKTIKFLSDNVKILTGAFITLAVGKITYAFFLLALQLKKTGVQMALFNVITSKNLLLKLLSVVLGLGTAIYAFKDSLFGATEAEKALEKQTKKTQKALAYLKKESRDHYKKQIHDQKMAARALKKESEAWDEAYKRNKITASANAMHEMMNQAIGDTEELTEKTKELENQYAHNVTAQELLKGGMTALNNVMVTAFADVIMRVKSFDEALRNVANVAIRQLVEGFIQLAIVAPILKIMEEWLKNIGWLQKDLNAQLRKTLWYETAIAAVRGVAKIFGLQHGGPAKKGHPYMVGEAGPEMFVPKTSGTVIPNSQLGGGAEIGGEVNVNFNISTVDASAFDELLLSRKSLIIGTIQQAFQQQGRRFV